ncbi:serine protease [Streptomyces sp. NPDC091292]|uniref:serine protease n=1 Tax=Streptomyces sp. NPDC091292 TaxID=3365991 RepID=UPI0037FAA246
MTVRDLPYGDHGDLGDRGAPDRSLVRICDLAGRPRGVGFAADDRGTVVTAHETVDGLPRIVLHTDGGRTCVVTSDAVVPLPAAGLALVHTEGLDLVPLPVTVRDRIPTGTYVRIAAGGWREARVLGTTPVTYTATDRFHLIGSAMELAVGTAGSDALRLGGIAAGGPVIDAGTGAVVAVIGTALEAGRSAAGFAVPLRTVGAEAAGAGFGALSELLAVNAWTVPAYGTDLNLAGVLHLTATSTGSDGPRPPLTRTVERPYFVRELADFEAGGTGALVLALVGEPGTGRTTELAAFAARRSGGTEPAPTLWLRGADLHADDASLADAALRALTRAARIAGTVPDVRPEPAGGEAGAGAGERAGVRGGRAWGVRGAGAHRASSGARRGGGAGAGEPYEGDGVCGGVSDGVAVRQVDLGDVSPERIARVARECGRPLVLVLDGPEEMPPALAHRLADWTARTTAWLCEHGARLALACRPEYWEHAEAHIPAHLTTRVPLGDLSDTEAHQVRAWLGIPDGTLPPADARHPLTLALLAEVGAATPPGAPGAPDGQPDRDQVLTAYLDLMCLRIAVRLAAPLGLRGTAVRRLAAQVSGQVHKAARSCLGPGQGELDRATFETVFPWRTGWASAVLTEGLLTPAGSGFRFAYEEVADWIQGAHLDLEAALEALVGAGRGRGRAVPPVPRHRIGPVVQALLLFGRERGDAQLAVMLGELTAALDRGRSDGPACPEASEAVRVPAQGAAPVAESAGQAVPVPVEGVASDSLWWATRLLTGVLLRVRDTTSYLGVLRDLADRIAAGRVPGSDGAFGPAFWCALPLPDGERLDLLRRLVVADAPQDSGARPPTAPQRHLDAAATLLVADPAAVQPHLTRWFADERPLRAAPDATVATAAQALLHTHRHRAMDDLTEALVVCTHPRAGELLTVLAEEEPSALCRAVDRWAHDIRPDRHVAAAAYGVKVVPYATGDADRDRLRHAALTLLARPSGRTLHGAALALLVRDPRTRARHLPRALQRFAAGDAALPAAALAPALGTHPEPVLAAFAQRLRDAPPAIVADALRTLADVTAPGPARRVAALVRELLGRRPEPAVQVAGFVALRLEHGPSARTTLVPLVSGALHGGSPAVRAALAPVLAATGTQPSRALRAELLETLLAAEREPDVLTAVLRALADGAAARGDARTRELVHRVGVALVRTPEGAVAFDRTLVERARAVPGFAALTARWLTGAPQEWAALVGPSARRTIEDLAGVRVPA